MKQKLLEMIQITVWLHTDEFIFVWFYKNDNTKNGRQNWVTSTGGRHNLVPGLHSYRRGPVCSVECPFSTDEDWFSVHFRNFCLLVDSIFWNS